MTEAEHLGVIPIRGSLHHDGCISALVSEVEEAGMLNVLLGSKAKLTQSFLVLSDQLGETIIMG